MRVVIIEDEPIAAEQLEAQLQACCPEARVLAVHDTVKEAVTWLRAHPAPDLLLVDIHLADGLSFDIFEQVPVSSPVIFTTAYDEYAIRAFEVNSLHYLLKPIKPADLQRSLQKFQALQAQRPSAPAPDLAALRTLLQPQKAYKERFLVKAGQRLSPVSTDQIAYFFAEDKLVFLVTADQRKYPVSYTLDQLAEQLDPALFFKPSRHFLIRADSVESIYPHRSNRLRVQLKPQPPRELIVSYEKSAAFKEWLEK